jgi:Rap1a immunity proteins
MSALNWVSYMAVAGLAMSLGSTSTQAASANKVLMDAGECLGAVYALLTVSHTLAEPLKFCPPVEFDAEQGVRVVVAYIEKRLERVGEDFTTLALEALRSKVAVPVVGVSGGACDVLAFPQDCVQGSSPTRLRSATV